MITVRINGQAREVPNGLTLELLLDWLQLPRDRVAVERNLEIVPRTHWVDTPIDAGDSLEVVHFVGGGSDASRAKIFDLWSFIRRTAIGIAKST